MFLDNLVEIITTQNISTKPHTVSKYETTFEITIVDHLILINIKSIQYNYYSFFFGNLDKYWKESGITIKTIGHHINGSLCQYVKLT